jgi:predicted esterase
MKRENNFITVQKTARLTWLKNEEQNNPNLLIVLHGYGHLSTFFSRKFETLVQTQFDVLIPEGLNRFYLEGSSGRVGASWMTREEREMDIQDNHQYLQQIIENYSKDYQDIVLMGFSQGGATAARFYFEKQQFFKGLILWASVFPPDLHFPLAKVKTENCHFVLGEHDPYFPIEKQKEVLTLHQELGMKVHLFEGKHDIDGKILQTILLNL